MSNREFVQNLYAAFAAGDIEKVLGMMHPNVGFDHADHEVWQGARVEAQRAVVVTLQEREGNGRRALWSLRFDRRALRKANGRTTRSEIRTMPVSGSRWPLALGR